MWNDQQSQRQQLWRSFFKRLQSPYLPAPTPTPHSSPVAHVWSSSLTTRLPSLAWKTRKNNGVMQARSEVTRELGKQGGQENQGPDSRRDPKFRYLRSCSLQVHVLSPKKKTNDHLNCLTYFYWIREQNSVRVKKCQHRFIQSTLSF